MIREVDEVIPGWGSGELTEECRDGVDQITFGLQ